MRGLICREKFLSTFTIRGMMILALFFLGGVLPQRQAQASLAGLPTQSGDASASTSCQYDDQCGDSMCKIWKDGRFVCEPRQYGVAVWTNNCIDKVEKTMHTTLEAPLDQHGQPDLKQAVVIGIEAKLRCSYHIEVRSR